MPKTRCNVVRLQIANLSQHYRRASHAVRRLTTQALNLEVSSDGLIDRLDDDLVHATTLLGELRELGLRSSGAKVGNDQARERRRLRAELHVTLAQIAIVRGEKADCAGEARAPWLARLEKRRADVRSRLAILDGHQQALINPRRAA